MIKVNWWMVLLLGLILGASPALAQEGGSLIIGADGGLAISLAGDATEGDGGTEFNNDLILGGGVMYRLPMGLALGVDLHHLALDYDVNGVKFATYRQWPLMVWVRYMGKKEQGLTGHAGVGVGVNFPSVDEKREWAEALTGFVSDDLELDVDVDTSFVFGADAGLDYFLSPEFAVSLGARFMYSKADYTAVIDGQEEASGTFQGHSLSFLVGLTYWFNF